MRKQYLEAGKIVGTHGVRGELRVQSWCDTPDVFCTLKILYFEQGSRPVKVVSSRPHKNIILVRLEGIETVEKADALRETILYMDRRDLRLEKGAYFIQDLIGLKVLDADTGVAYGTLTDVIKTGANDVYEVTGGDSSTHLVPVIPEVVVRVDLEEEKVFLRPLKGIFDDED